MPIGVQHHMFHGSTAIRSASYNEDRRELTVAFHSGNTYDLTGIPPNVWKEFTEASSPGAYWHQNLKGAYT